VLRLTPERPAALASQAALVLPDQARPRSDCMEPVSDVSRPSRNKDDEEMRSSQAQRNDTGGPCQLAKPILCNRTLKTIAPLEGLEPPADCLEGSCSVR
jgi:hypothetical protein